MNYAKRRDSNEGAIVKALEQAGAHVIKISEKGVPDLLVSHLDVLYLIEVKDPTQKGGSKYNTGEGALTEAQAKWWANWRGKKPAVVTNAAEALAAIGVAPF